MDPIGPVFLLERTNKANFVRDGRSLPPDRTNKANFVRSGGHPCPWGRTGPFTPGKWYFPMSATVGISRQFSPNTVAGQTYPVIPPNNNSTMDPIGQRLSLIEP